MTYNLGPPNYILNVWHYDRKYSFENQYHLHGLHYNMKYYDCPERSDYYASDVYIEGD